MRLLRAALATKELPLEQAIRLVEYHVRRNRIAKFSREKTWYAKHEGVKFLLL